MDMYICCLYLRRRDPLPRAPLELFSNVNAGLVALVHGSGADIKGPARCPLPRGPLDTRRHDIGPRLMDTGRASEQNPGGGARA
jgi:hypothetical protein